jgi:hypothetical protein
MALLKKIQSATLIEALVATALIVVVFIVASLVLNNLLLNSFSKNTHTVENRIFELQYQAKHSNLVLPYHEEFDNWDIAIIKVSIEGKTWQRITALNSQNKKEVVKSTLCIDQK